jgi:hypothetical protein
MITLLFKYVAISSTLRTRYTGLKSVQLVCLSLICGNIPITGKKHISRFRHFNLSVTSIAQIKRTKNGFFRRYAYQQTCQKSHTCRCIGRFGLEAETEGDAYGKMFLENGLRRNIRKHIKFIITQLYSLFICALIQ